MDKQQLNMMSLQEITEQNPLINSTLSKFYDQNFGEGPNRFIKNDYRFRDYHDAVYNLLLVLDQYGDTTVYFDPKNNLTFNTELKKNKIQIRSHTLDVTIIVLRALKYSNYELKDCGFRWNLKMLWGGIAALSCNIGFAFGKEFIERYNNDICEASLALLEKLPAVSRLRELERIKTLVKLFHIYERPCMQYHRYRLEEHKQLSTDLGIVRLLLNANMQIKRSALFDSKIENNPAFTFGRETNKKAIHEANHIAVRAEKERESSEVNLVDEIQREAEPHKRMVSVAELKGLRNNKIYKSELIIKDKIIAALKRPNQQGLAEAEKELEDFKAQTLSITDKFD